MFKVLRDWIQRYFSDEEAVVLAVLLFLAFTAVLTLGGMLAPVLAGMVLAYLMQGLVVTLERLRVPGGVAVGLVFALFMGLLLVFIVVVVPLLWHQLITLFNELPGMLAKWQSLLLLLPERYPHLVSDEQVLQAIEAARGEIGKFGQWALTFSLSSLPLLVNIMIYLVLVPILVFFFLKDRAMIGQWVRGYLPRERALITRVAHEMNRQIANYIRGKVIEIFICGGVTYIAFVVLELNYAALLALLVGISVVVPYVGAVVVTVPVFLIALFQWGWSDQFIYLMAVYGIIQTLDGNVLVPLLFSEAVNLHPVAIICAVLLFGGLWGFWGGVLRDSPGDAVQGRAGCLAAQGAGGGAAALRGWFDRSVGLMAPSRASSLPQLTELFRKTPSNVGAGLLAKAPSQASIESGLVQCLSSRQNRINMPRHLHAAPFLTQYAILVDQERAAIHAHVFLAVELFQLDHVEQLTDGFVLVADQLKGEFLFALEVLVGFEAVARHAEHFGIGGLERSVLITKALPLGRAARGAVLGVEVDHYLLAFQAGEADGLPAGGGGLEIGNRLVDGNGHESFLTLGSVGARVRSGHRGSARRQNPGTDRAAS